MKYPFSYLYGVSDYVIIILCSLTSFLLLSNIHYSKFPIIKYNLLFNNAKKIIGSIIFIVVSILAIIYNQHNIVILFFMTLYIIGGIIKAIFSKYIKL